MYSQIFTFALVRHTIDYFLSLYHHVRREHSYYHSALNPGQTPGKMHLNYEILKNVSPDNGDQLLLEGRLKHNKTTLVR